MRKALCALSAMVLLSSCTHERADLEVTLTPPIASRFVVHGNCFAGWYISFDVIVYETRGVDVVLESVSLRVEDSAAGLLGERMVDAVYLGQRRGEIGVVVDGHASYPIPMSVGAVKCAVDAPAINGSIVASGEIVASDAQGTIRSSYRIPATVRVDDRPVPTSGACTRRPGE